MSLTANGSGRLSAPAADRADSPWAGHDFACCLTHDVDHLRKYVSSVNWVRRMGADVFRRHDAAIIARRFVEGVGESRGRGVFRRDFKWLLETERQRRITASYFFLAHEKPPRGEYGLAEAQEMIRDVEEAGMEAGLHGSLESFKDEQMLREEKARLDSVVRNKSYGVRQHYLNIVEPDTWRIQSKVGFLYDCTYGWRDREGFRAGTCFPFRPVDPDTGSEINIWEIPLTAMDGTLAQYRKLTPEQGLDVMKKLVLEVKQAHGVFCLLWHNSSLDNVDWRGWRETYLAILDFILEQNGWIASGREIVESWEKNGA